jgi:hypothetical protein
MLPKKICSCIIIITRRVVRWRRKLRWIERLIWKLSWRRDRPRINHAEMIIEGIEIGVQCIKSLLQVILPGLKLLILLLCGQCTKLCIESINIIMQPLLNILETSHDGLIHGRVKMLPKVL